MRKHFFPTYFGFYVTVVTATEAGGRYASFDGIRLPRFYDEPERKAMEKFLGSRNIKTDAKTCES